MKYAKKAMAAGLLTAASLGVSQPAAHAVTFAENGDAGQTLSTAQFTASSPANSGQSLTAITGTIGTATDADLYEFTITSTTTFSAIATGNASSTGSGAIDTSLFLFNASGVPIIANDDTSNGSYQASIAAGNTLVTTLTAGTYYLGISLSGNEPVNLNSQPLFTADQPTTSVRGIASGLNPTTEGTFNGQTFYPETGTYSIALTGAATLAVPEPSTYATLALGTGALALFLRRRRSVQA